VGRSLADLSAVFKEGGGGVEELKRRWVELTGITDEVTGHLAQTVRQINELKAAFTGLGVKIYEEFRDPIRDTIADLKAFLDNAGPFISVLHEIGTAIGQNH